MIVRHYFGPQTSQTIKFLLYRGAGFKGYILSVLIFNQLVISREQPILDKAEDRPLITWKDLDIASIVFKSFVEKSRESERPIMKENHRHSWLLLRHSFIYISGSKNEFQFKIYIQY